MMVLVPPSNSAEDSQSRQLPINKKLSKALSCVPRSRFQKVLPKVLSGSKRPDTRSALAKKCQPVENPSQKDLKCTSIEKTREPAQNAQIPEITVIGKKEPAQNAQITEITVIGENNGSTNAEIITIIAPELEDFSEKGNNNQDTQGTQLNLDETLENGIDSNSFTISNIDSTSNNTNCSSTSSLNIKSPKKKSEKNDASSIIHEENKEQNTENASVLGEKPSQTSAEPERNDIANTNDNVSNTTEKSFKYPHLTGLLSKKRREPVKEADDKRWKKFSKDNPPERSKMKMRDLIYWNPANNRPTKDVSTVDEAFSSPIEEEACPDGDLEENNVFDSAPKLVIAEDGTINIDQSSLIVSRNIPEPKSMKIV